MLIDCMIADEAAGMMVSRVTLKASSSRWADAMNGGLVLQCGSFKSGYEKLIQLCNNNNMPN